mmetsp:Transcript_41727/g.103675  ORF Transcript_41727/g.103675 Transcript_41727/m.103675 type:complete len:86 (-) Transcript_41727:497-754(-)
MLETAKPYARDLNAPRAFGFLHIMATTHVDQLTMNWRIAFIDPSVDPLPLIYAQDWEQEPVVARETACDPEQLHWCRWLSGPSLE